MKHGTTFSMAGTGYRTLAIVLVIAMLMTIAPLPEPALAILPTITVTVDDTNPAPGGTVAITITANTALDAEPDVRIFVPGGAAEGTALTLTEETAGEEWSASYTVAASGSDGAYGISAVGAYNEDPLFGGAGFYVGGASASTQYCDVTLYQPESTSTPLATPDPVSYFYYANQDIRVKIEGTGGYNIVEAGLTTDTANFLSSKDVDVEPNDGEVTGAGAPGATYEFWCDLGATFEITEADMAGNPALTFYVVLSNGGAPVVSPVAIGLAPSMNPAEMTELFGGDTTDWSTIDDFTDVTNLIFVPLVDGEAKVKCDFSGTSFNLTDPSTIQWLAGLGEKMESQEGLLSIDALNSAMAGRSAEITLYDLGCDLVDGFDYPYVTFIDMDTLSEAGVDASSLVDYTGYGDLDSEADGDDLKFKVGHFTSYGVAPHIVLDAIPSSTQVSTQTVSGQVDDLNAELVLEVFKGDTLVSTSTVEADANGEFETTASFSAGAGAYTLQVYGINAVNILGYDNAAITYSTGSNGGSSSSDSEDEATTEKVVDTSKNDTVEASDGSYKLTVPAGAINAETGSVVTVSVTELEDTAITQLLTGTQAPPGFTSIGRAFEFTAEAAKGGTTTGITSFAKPLTLEIVLSADDLKNVTDPNKVGLFKVRPDGTLQFIGGKIVNGKLVIQMSGFSKYVLGEVIVSFSDMLSHWAKTDTELMAAKYIVRGMADGSFKPGNGVTRAEFAAMAARAMNLTGGSGAQTFKDVKSSDWFYADVTAASSAGIITGYNDGTFRPNEPITREQIATILARALTTEAKATALTPSAVTAQLAGFSDATSVSGWAQANLALAVQEVLVTGKTVAGSSINKKLAPKDGATRGEAATMISRYWKK